VTPFFEDMATRLRDAHYVIARAGAATVSELQAIPRPALLIPYPHAMEDHQTANAKAFTQAGYGTWCPQDTATPTYIATQLHAMLRQPLHPNGNVALPKPDATALSATESLCRLIALVLGGPSATALPMPLSTLLDPRQSPKAAYA
jgi:UDP-N-acetylglucosamine--N-acetylmuramyl-(pentapeptide) pyrophosphoryl-undecaprenol N-acetylglucosamine transferase